LIVQRSRPITSMRTRLRCRSTLAPKLRIKGINSSARRTIWPRKNPTRRLWATGARGNLLVTDQMPGSGEPTAEQVGCLEADAGSLFIEPDVEVDAIPTSRRSASNNSNSALQSEKIRQGPASPGFWRASDPRVEHRASRSCDPVARVLCARQNDVALVAYP
jgi:hypothetical protein